MWQTLSARRNNSLFEERKQRNKGSYQLWERSIPTCSFTEGLSTTTTTKAVWLIWPLSWMQLWLTDQNGADARNNGSHSDHKDNHENWKFDGVGWGSSALRWLILEKKKHKPHKTKRSIICGQLDQKNKMSNLPTSSRVFGFLSVTTQWVRMRTQKSVWCILTSTLTSTQSCVRTKGTKGSSQNIHTRRKVPLTAENPVEYVSKNAKHRKQVALKSVW